MNRALDALGLDAGADERAIKRAYAQRLRAARPDGDPVAFQALHEAYQEALQWVRNRAQWQEESSAEALTSTAADNSPPDPPAPYDSHSPMDHMSVLHHPCTLDTDMPDVVEPSLNLPRFARRLINTAGDADPASFEHWLAGRPELWSGHESATWCCSSCCNRAARCASPISICSAGISTGMRSGLISIPTGWVRDAASCIATGCCSRATTRSSPQHWIFRRTACPHRKPMPAWNA